jgi:DNA helicase HerA-like ATPase
VNYFPLLTAVVAFVGRPRVAQDDWKLGDFFYLPLKEYAQKGILVSGASGAGKTVAAKAIVEELLEDRMPALIFDYTQQWQRLLEKTAGRPVGTRRIFGARNGSKINACSRIALVRLTTSGSS